MTTRNRKPRPRLKESRQQLSVCTAEPQSAGASFHALLRGGTPSQPGWTSVLQSISRFFRTRTASLQRATPGALAGTWSWLHSKYTLTATKRLRIAETVSLGEKRFVAIVTVEGREFLIGGGAAGISLLAKLGSPSASEADPLQALAMERGDQ